jgi:hypothetical protein
MVRGRLTVNGAKKRGRIALLLAGEFSSRPRGTITTLAVAGACCEVEVWGRGRRRDRGHAYHGSFHTQHVHGLSGTLLKRTASSPGTCQSGSGCKRRPRGGGGLLNRLMILASFCQATISTCRYDALLVLIAFHY